MTTGSKIADNSSEFAVYKYPGGQLLGYGKIGSYSSKVWSGSDRPKVEPVRWARQFDRIPILTKPKPGRYAMVTVWKKKRVRRWIPAVAPPSPKPTVLPGTEGKGSKRGRAPRLLASKAKEPKGHYVYTVVRYRTKKAVWLKPTPGGKFTGFYRLRYKRVQYPKPAKNSAPENPYTMSYVTWRDSPATYSRRIYPVPDTVTDREETVAPNFWFNGAAPNISNPWDSNDDIALLGKLREKVAGSDFNAAVFLAEGGQSLGMIANAATRIQKSLTALKKGNLQKAWKALSDDKTPRGLSPRKEIGSNWLEMQYGWLPLLQDAEGGAQFLAHLHSGGNKQVVRTSKSKTHTSSRPKGEPGSWYDIGFNSFTRCSVKCILEDVSAVGLSGLLDPLSVAWEKLPYSFVADWFIPIGDYLAARGLASSLKGTFVISKVTYTSYSGSTFSTTEKDPWRAAFTSNSCFYRSVQFDRTVSNSLSVPLPVAKPLGQAASWKRAANAVALLSQLRR